MFIDNVNEQIQFNVALAYDIGLKVPSSIFLGNKTTAEVEEIIADSKWDITDPLLAMLKVGGWDVTFSAWWSGEELSFHTVIINDRFLLTGQQGIKLNANCVTVFSGKSPAIQSIQKKLCALLKEKAPEYRGFVNLSVRLDGDKDNQIVYYQRIKFSTLPDYIYPQSKLANMSMEEMIACMEGEVAKDKPEGFGASLRLYSYPYETYSNKAAIIPWIDQYDFEVQESDETYLRIGKGKNIKDAWRDVYSGLSGLNESGVCYRTDGDVLARRTFNYLKKEHYL